MENKETTNEYESEELFRGYYDVEIPLERESLDELFYLKDLKQRKLFMNSDVDPLSAEEIIHHILQYNKEDIGIPVEKRKAILLYITSSGGDVDSGFALIDIIKSSKTPVYTINYGYWYSMAMLIGLAGHKRYATRNAKFLMHDGSHFVYNSGAKAQDQMEFQKKTEERIKEYILTESRITLKEYTDKFRVEWYMFADEAKDKGVVDYIIGEDCELEEVI